MAAKQAVQKFESAAGFLAWAQGDPEKRVEFPYPGNSNFTVQLSADELAIVSPGYYHVKKRPNYWAPKIVGITFPFGPSGEEASGMVAFSLEGEELAVERRRITGLDKIGDGDIFISTFNAVFDRVEEPVAVIVRNGLSKVELTKKTDQWWLDQFKTVRDSVELAAVRELMQWVEV